MRKSRRPRKHRLLRWLIRLIVLWLILTWLPVLIMRFVPPQTSAFMLEHRISGWLHQRKTTVHYQWIGWTQMNKQVPLAMVASENQLFPFDHGFNFHAIHKAIDTAEAGGRLRGASTITQQTAKNLFLWGGRNIVRKGLEAYFTVLIDVTWPKRRILEVYANIAQLGPDTYGVGAAARQLFHKPQSALSRREAAQMAAVLPNPLRMHAARPSAYVAQRASWIERQMRQLGGTTYITSKHPPRPRQTQ